MGSLAGGIAIPLNIPTCNPGSGNALGWTPGIGLLCSAVAGSGGGSGVSSLTGDGKLFSNTLSSGAVTLVPTSFAAHAFLIGPISGSAALPTARALIAADLPSDVTYLDQSQSFTKGISGAVSAPSIATSTFTPDLNLANSFNIGLVHASCPCTIQNAGKHHIARRSERCH